MSVAKSPICNLQSLWILWRPSSVAQIAATIGTLLIFSQSSPQVRADVFELASGGRFEGKLLPADEANKSSYTIDLAAGGRLIIPRSQITKIESISVTQAEYHKLAR